MDDVFFEIILMTEKGGEAHPPKASPPQKRRLIVPMYQTPLPVMFTLKKKSFNSFIWQQVYNYSHILSRGIKD